jgi:hypothetical protein
MPLYTMKAMKVENKAYHSWDWCKCAIVVARLPHDINFLLVPACTAVVSTKALSSTITPSTHTHTPQKLPPKLVSLDTCYKDHLHFTI